MANEIERGVVTAEPGAPLGLFRWGGQVFKCALGRSGIIVDKREGDGGTPAGLLPLRKVMYRADRGAAPIAQMRVEPIAPNDGWCDEVNDPNYNRQVTLPFAPSHEDLWLTENVYDIIGVLGWNDDPVVKGRGSAIFLHVAAPDFGPTAGCIALTERDLRTVLAGGMKEIEVRA